MKPKTRTVYSYEQKTIIMKKLALLIALSFYFNQGQAQFLDSADFEDFNNYYSSKEFIPAHSVFAYKNSEQFDSARLSIHLGFENFKYKVYYYDSSENIIDVEAMDFNRISSNGFKIKNRRIALLDLNGRFLKMIYIDPNI